MQISISQTALVITSAASLLLCGCWGGSGPKLADVTGSVKLDGKPLTGATVTFIPVVQEGSSSRAATAITDSDGDFTLEFSTGRTGVLPGKYTVAIRTYSVSSEDDDGSTGAVTPEKVPEVYNSKTTLTAEVASSGGHFPFVLRSDAGPVVQPTNVSDESADE